MRIDKSVKLLKMNAFAVVLVMVVFGSCVMSYSNESGNDDDSCLPHLQLSSIHPIAILGYLSCFDDLSNLKELYAQYWALAYEQTLSSDELRLAEKFKSQFDQSFDYLFIYNQNIFKIIKTGLMNMHNRLFPKQKVFKLYCNDDAAFKVKKEWSLW